MCFEGTQAPRSVTTTASCITKDVTVFMYILLQRNDPWSTCDPLFFSLKGPNWADGSFMCSITDSTTSFIGIPPTPIQSPSGSGGSSTLDSIKKLLTPVYLGAPGAFLLLLVIMVGVIYYIRRGRRAPRSYMGMGERAHMLSTPLGNSGGESRYDTDSMMSMGTPQQTRMEYTITTALLSLLGVTCSQVAVRRQRAVMLGFRRLEAMQ